MRPIAWLAAALSLIILANAGAATNKASTASAKAPLKIGKIVFAGGDGSSIEKAILIKNAKDEIEGVDAEIQWLKKVHPDWKKGPQSLLNQKDRSYDKVEYTTAKGEKKVIFFDITEFFGKF